jgi:hypothetical protein
MRAHVVGELQHIAFERENALAGPSDIDRGDTAPEIELSRPVGRVGAKSSISRCGMTGFDLCTQVVDGCCRSGECERSGSHCRKHAKRVAT